MNYVNSMDDLDLDVKTNGAIEMAPAHKDEVTARVSTRNVMPKTAKTLGLAGRYIQVGPMGALRMRIVRINALRRLVCLLNTVWSIATDHSLT